MGMKESEIYMIESLQDTCCIVMYTTFGHHFTFQFLKL